MVEGSSSVGPCWKAETLKSLDIQTFTQLTVLKPSLPSNLPIRSTLEDLCL